MGINLNYYYLKGNPIDTSNISQKSVSSYEDLLTDFLNSGKIDGTFLENGMIDVLDNEEISNSTKKVKFLGWRCVPADNSTYNNYDYGETIFSIRTCPGRNLDPWGQAWSEINLYGVWAPLIKIGNIYYEFNTDSTYKDFFDNHYEISSGRENKIDSTPENCYVLPQKSDIIGYSIFPNSLIPIEIFGDGTEQTELTLNDILPYYELQNKNSLDNYVLTLYPITKKNEANNNFFYKVGQNWINMKEHIGNWLIGEKISNNITKDDVAIKIGQSIKSFCSNQSHVNILPNGTIYLSGTLRFSAPVYDDDRQYDLATFSVDILEDKYCPEWFRLSSNGDKRPRSISAFAVDASSSNVRFSDPRRINNVHYFVGEPGGIENESLGQFFFERSETTDSRKRPRNVNYFIIITPLINYKYGMPGTELQ